MFHFKSLGNPAGVTVWRVWSFWALGALLLFGLPGPASAEDCSPQTINALKQQCLVSLRDVESTIISGQSVHRAGDSKATEAFEPGLDCLKGGYDIMKAAAKDCNPATPGTDPVACIDTLVGVPDTVAACRRAYELASEAISLYHRASVFYGAAGVAFSDQGGDEIAERLRACNENNCHNMNQALIAYAADSRDRAERDRAKLERFRESLSTNERALTRCQADRSQCSENPENGLPSLEGLPGASPEISIP